ncbi:DUF2207 domain-containing protein [Auraticoccus monumenti]|uniref:Predicted membrane protein n=1 Tax=Auraticoccus monumenti TaxID=675864 RepID=A0A1G7CIX4_9ACTN|nr:DUF2207 domain-containing protein [Auraticoccus monumenti]SDE39344.1 Predicted membrane protein [Auraticoccus monumenti]
MAQPLLLPSGTSPTQADRPLLLRALLVALAGVLLLVSAPGPARAEDQGEDWRITRYDVTAETASDGTTRVTTELDFDFGDEPAHGPVLVQAVRQRIEGDPDHWRSMPITDVSATSPSGAPAQVSTEVESGAMDIRVGDADVEVEGLQTYVVTWVQQGLVNPEATGSGLDELSWNVLNQWQVPVEDITVTVRGPAEVEQVGCFAGEPGTRTPCTSAAEEGTTATFTDDGISTDEGLTVVTGWPAGSVTAPVLLTERRHLGNTFAANPLTVGGGLLVAALGALLAALLARRGRDERYVGLTPGLSPLAGAEATTATGGARGPVAVRFTPPDGAGPAEVGTVQDEVAHTADVTAALVDLAVRGHLRIVDTRGPGDTDDAPTWRLERLTGGDDELADYEQVLLDGVFSTGDEVDLDGLVFAPALASTQTALYRRVTERGWFRADPRAVRHRWAGGAALVLVAGVVLTIVLALTVGAGIIGLGLVVAGVVGLALTGRAPARTAAGSALLEQSLGFKLYLSTAEADQIKLEEAEQVFSRYLPYAIAFGVAEHWTGVFAELAARGHALDTPTWYAGAHPFVFTGAAFGDQISSFSSAVSSAVTTSTAGSGGGSGFSAGVGGGVGGGGGGGW